MSAERRAGWSAAVCGLLLLAHAGWLVPAVAAPRTWVSALAHAPEAGALAAMLAAGSCMALALAGLVQWALARRMTVGTRGRARLMGLGQAAALLAFTSAPLLILLGQAGLEAVRSGLVFSYSLAGLMGSLAKAPRLTLNAVIPLAALEAATGLVFLEASWFLVSPRVRRVLWTVADLSLLVGVVLLSRRFTLRPADGDEAALWGAVARLAVTSFFASRVLARLLPVILDAIETVGFRPLVASRHLRARKSGFLAIISILSTLAVAVSSCMLVTVLSVMGGFRYDLKRKILGNNAHVIADVESGGIEGWAGLLTTIRALPGVVGAAPFVSGEVMVTSASNNGGAVLRGIDPRAIAQVSDLEQNLTSGRIEYLLDPEKLLHLPPEERRRALPLMGDDSFLPGLPTDGEDEDEPEAGAVDEVRVEDDLAAPVGEAPLGEAAEDDAPKPADAGVGDDGSAKPDEDAHDEADARRREIEEFLKDEGGRADPAEVLPGVIIGQELARSLRVYVGDEIDIISPLGDLGPTGPVPKTRPFRVAGVFYSGMYEYDMKYIYVTLDSAQAFLGTGDAIRGIEIKVADPDDAPAVAGAVRALPAAEGLRVRDWQQMNQSLFGALELEKLAMFVTLGIAILIAGFCVFGTLTLMVQEKGREVGILKAMGASGDAILRIFLVEGLMIGVLGAGVGLGLGFLLTFAAEHFGVTLSAEVYYIDKLPVHVDPIEFGLVGVASILVCVLATVVPAVVASKLRPVDALRYE